MHYCTHHNGSCWGCPAWNTGCRLTVGNPGSWKRDETLKYPGYSPDMGCHYAWISEKILFRETGDSPVDLAGLHTATNVSVAGKYELIWRFLRQKHPMTFTCHQRENQSRNIRKLLTFVMSTVTWILGTVIGCSWVTSHHVSCPYRKKYFNCRLKRSIKYWKLFLKEKSEMIHIEFARRKIHQKYGTFFLHFPPLVHKLADIQSPLHLFPLFLPNVFILMKHSLSIYNIIHTSYIDTDK